jgi:2,5-diamino-6-(ribosylamino)-4(3H)-pyrimidinone 5'-phosphate reductase
VTWAQSLDSKIAGPGGQRVLLSGTESMLMTHWWVPSCLGDGSAAVRSSTSDLKLMIRMRSMHDAIMVGVNTVIMDDPRLQSMSNT